MMIKVGSKHNPQDYSHIWGDVENLAGMTNKDVSASVIEALAGDAWTEYISEYPDFGDFLKHTDYKEAVDAMILARDRAWLDSAFLKFARFLDEEELAQYVKDGLASIGFQQHFSPEPEITTDTLAKLRAMSFGDDAKVGLTGGLLSPTVMKAVYELPSGAYVSFVGHFGVADDAPLVDRQAVEACIGDDVGDYYATFSRMYRSMLLQHAVDENWTVLERGGKGSLTVTVFGDPAGEPGWGIVVADCPEGGWFEAVRVDLSSFEGGAAFPSGCEVRILQ